METLRLRRIQEPSRVERLLDAFITRTATLTDGSYQVRSPRELPEVLRDVVARATAQGETWACWAHGSHLCLFICEMSLALSRERGAPVILVRQYNDDADITDSGTWTFDTLGTWTRCSG